MEEKWYHVFNRRTEVYDDPLEISEYCWSGKAVEPEYIDGRIKIIVGELALERGHSLLEAGCGCNVILSRLSGYAGACCGSDPAFEMLRAGRRVMELPVVCAEAVPLPFQDAVFDRVLSYNVFMHLPDIEYAVEAALEMARVAKPGGVVFIGEIPHIGKKEEYRKRRERESDVFKSDHFDPRIRTNLEQLWHDPEIYARRLEREQFRHSIIYPHPGGGFLDEFRFAIKIFT
jgi:SAM-dependent methyltransferase